MFDRMTNGYSVANIRQMPIPTNEPEHFEDWKPFFGYGNVDGCIVNYLYFHNISGNLDMVQKFKILQLSQDFYQTKKEILGICIISFFLTIS
jgi:hypothetical protein